MNYKLYEKKIRAIAGKLSRKSGINYDDLMSEGNIAFINCLKKYDSSKGDFDPYLGASVYHAMIDFIKSEYKYRNHYELKDIDFLQDNSPRPDAVAGFNLMLESLGKDAAMVAETVLNMPFELIEMAKGHYTSKVTKHTVKNYLIKRGWKHPDVDRAFDEIKEALC